MYGKADYSGFDGLGHLCTATTGGNFGAGNVDTATTNYKPGSGTYPGAYFVPWPSWQPWVLNACTEQVGTEASSTGP